MGKVVQFGGMVSCKNTVNKSQRTRKSHENHPTGNSPPCCGWEDDFPRFPRQWQGWPRGEATPWEGPQVTSRAVEEKHPSRQAVHESWLRNA